MFKITYHKGFHLTFSNGWTVSVQFGPGNYTEKYSLSFDYDAPRRTDIWEAGLAEVAAWTKDGEMISLGNDTVKGYVPSDKVAAFIYLISTTPEKADEFFKEQ